MPRYIGGVTNHQKGSCAMAKNQNNKHFFHCIRGFEAKGVKRVRRNAPPCDKVLPSKQVVDKITKEFMELWCK